jgi:hypothetical protein
LFVSFSSFSFLLTMVFSVILWLSPLCIIKLFLLWVNVIVDISKKSKYQNRKVFEKLQTNMNIKGTENNLKICPLYESVLYRQWFTSVLYGKFD